MTYNILATGSGGNAVIINKNILIDCGVPWKTLEPYAQDLRLVLLTHAHGDHFKPSTVARLHKQRPGIRWGCCEWMVHPLVDAGVSKTAIDVFEGTTFCGYSYPGLCFAKAKEIPHNARNCAWFLKGHNGEGKLFYATDCATLYGIEAKCYDLYMIEANHGEAEIQARIDAKRAAGKCAYEIEAARNHLSEEQALDWLARNMGPNSRYVFLHQHIEKGGIHMEKIYQTIAELHDKLQAAEKLLYEIEAMLVTME